MEMRKLIAAIKQHSGMDNSEIRQAGEHGADAGWNSFTYYSDTGKFYDEYEELIWELLAQTADEMGQSINEVIGSFRTEYSDLDTFKNILAWFALESAGHYLEDKEEEE